MNSNGELTLSSKQLGVYQKFTYDVSTNNVPVDRLYSSSKVVAFNSLNVVKKRNSLTSLNCKNKVVLDQNGILNLYKDGNSKPIWTSRNFIQNEFAQSKSELSKTFNFVLLLQEDGNLVIYYMDPNATQVTADNNRLTICAANKYKASPPNSQIKMQDD
jgi:hypothetical protein